MPFNGSGTFSPLPRPNYPPLPGEVIYADRFVAVIDDILAGLTQCVTRNGQSSYSGNQNLNSYKFINAGPAVANGQFLVYGQSAGYLASCKIDTITDVTTFSLSPMVPTNPDLSGGSAAASQAYVETAVQRAIDTGIADTEFGLAALTYLVYLGA